MLMGPHWNKGFLKLSFFGNSLARVLIKHGSISKIEKRLILSLMTKIEALGLIIL